MNEEDIIYLNELIRKNFSSYPIKRIQEILEDYGRELSEKEITKVRIAIIQLSRYDINRLKELVAVAKNDYKKVLLWAA